MSEKDKELIETIFSSDEHLYPMLIEWNTGDPNPDTNTRGECTLEANGLIVVHTGGQNFAVTRLFKAECSTTAAIHPQGPRACSHAGMVTLGVNVSINDGVVTFQDRPVVHADGNRCLKGTRGEAEIMEIFKAFEGIDITP